MGTMIPRPGDAVIYVDAEGTRHNALILFCLLTTSNTALCAALARVLHHSTDHVTGVPHKSNGNPAFYWCWPNELDLEA